MGLNRKRMTGSHSCPPITRTSSNRRVIEASLNLHHWQNSSVKLEKADKKRVVRGSFFFYLLTNSQCYLVSIHCIVQPLKQPCFHLFFVLKAEAAPNSKHFIIQPPVYQCFMADGGEK